MKQNGFFARVVKTDKIKVDEGSHNLPPYKGYYDEYKVADYFCPEEWSNDGVFIPVKEGDPLWFDFQSNDDECAVLCAVQRINPVTGDPADLDGGLTKDPAQNYLRMPEQRWLDGYVKDGKVYQFVVTKAGIGLAVNEFVLPKHMQDSHAIGFAFFGPKNPKPKPAPVYRTPILEDYGYQLTKSLARKYGSSGMRSLNVDSFCSGALGDVSEGLVSQNCSMPVDDYTSIEVDANIDGITPDDSINFCGAVMAAGGDEVDEIDTVDILAEREADLTELDKASMGAGGRITQRIETDENTVDYYHEKRSALLTIYFALPEMYDAIMKRGKRQDAGRKDKYKMSGDIGGVPIPLIE